jgi:hypothetical protein
MFLDVQVINRGLLRLPLTVCGVTPLICFVKGAQKINFPDSVERRVSTASGSERGL